MMLQEEAPDLSSVTRTSLFTTKTGLNTKAMTRALTLVTEAALC